MSSLLTVTVCLSSQVMAHSTPQGILDDVAMVGRVFHAWLVKLFLMHRLATISHC